MDPQHRLLLEVAAEALEAAALAPSQLRGMRAGVYLGLCTGDYAWRQLRGEAPDARFDMYFATGTSFSMAPGRLAYALGLQGPALAVDTACSSSLVAVDLAVRSLRDRTTDLALAGGVSLLLSPVNSLCFAKSGMMASDGHCKTFDAAADGYVRGEGCGVVALKRLADAVAAGDPIWAVLRGSGVNQDGASAGLTVPNGEAQAQLIRSTLEQAQLDGDGIDVLEAHGTGTPLGDPIELKALAPIYGRDGRPAPLLLGSVKTNLGHLEGAAGVAGLIKAVLMVQRGQVPPHLHLRQPTPFVPWDQWAMTIPTALTPWPQSGRPRRAAVSSFGFSGTNAHVIVEQAPAEAVLPWPASGDDWLLLSARTPEALQQLAATTADWLAQQNEQAWGAICASSRASRSSGRCRLALQCSSPAAAAAALRAGAGLRGEATAQEPRLAWQLAAGAALEPSQQALQAWAACAIVPTALVHGPAAPSWLGELVGNPPQLRLAASLEALQEHGYSVSLPLEPPSLGEAVRLWLAGAAPHWSGFEPPAPWPRQVLPTTPFARARCWVEEDDAARLPSPLDLERSWQPLDAAAAQPFAGELQRVVSAELDAAPVLDQAFWQRWLPRLQQVLQASGPVHWVLEADATQAGPQAQAIAALLRTWLREAGAAAGALLWAGPDGRDLQQLLQAGTPPAGAEWRWNAASSRVEAAVLSAAPTERFAAPVPAIQPVATYLITGGLGALGLATARWLAQRGARHLLLVARRAPTEVQATAIAELEALGCRVDVESLDVADAQAVRDLLARIAADGRPLHGIVHAAGVLDDGLLSNQTPERCAALAATKLGGALALDAASRELAPALEFFVCYSSVAGLLGSPGQAAYGAANGALDGLMGQRRRAGLPGLSLAWGPWAGEGMASRAPQLLTPIQPTAALASLGRWLASGAAQGVVVDLKQASEHRLAPRCRALLAELEGLADAARLAAVQACLADLLADLGGFEVTELKADTSLYGLGLDSLMAVELATAVQAGLGVSLGLGALSGEPTLGSLAGHLLALLGDPAAASSAGVDLGAEAELPEALATQLASLPQPQPQPQRPPDTVLLTGATGFLGAFLLADQLRRHPQLNVWCLVRADGVGAAKARVRANLQHYDLWDDDFGARIVGLPGDLAQPRLGLDEATWAGLAERIGGILHNGAQLSYVAPYSQLKAPNVDGTLAVLQLAAAAGAPVEFISSTSVYEAAAYRGQAISETDDVAAWEDIHLGYSQSKWVSERLVLAAAAAGLPVTVYRPPLIGGHSLSGAWHEGDFLHRLVRGCLALGQAPDLAMELDLVPVDYVVAAIGALAWRAEPLGFHVHLHHPEPMLWADLLHGLIDKGAPLSAISLEQWLCELAQQPSNPLYPLQPFFTHRWGSEQLTYPELNAPGIKAKPSCTLTRAALAPLGVECAGFEALIGPYARTFLTL